MTHEELCQRLDGWTNEAASGWRIIHTHKDLKKAARVIRELSARVRELEAMLKDKNDEN